MYKRINQETPNWNGAVVCCDISKICFKDNFFDCIIDIEASSCNSLGKTKIFSMKFLEYLNHRNFI